MSAKTKTLGKRPGGLSDRASDVVLVVLCVAILLVVAYPLYYILVASFSDDSILLGYWNRIKYTVGGTLFSVVMIYITAYPLSRPIMAVMVVFSMAAYWNDWFTALIYMTGEGRAPLPLVLRNILIASETSASQASMISGGYAELNKLTEMIKFASIIVAAAPMLIHNCGTIPLAISLEGYGQMGKVDPGAAVLFRLGQAGEDA